jgi:hypothetical protein
MISAAGGECKRVYCSNERIVVGYKRQERLIGSPVGNKIPLIYLAGGVCGDRSSKTRKDCNVAEGQAPPAIKPGAGTKEIGVLDPVIEMPNKELLKS